MIYILGTKIEVGNKIMTDKKEWETVSTKFKDRIVTNKGTEILYGQAIYGYKIK